MVVVGLTGNIGSGKSTIAKAFTALGIPVFNSDEEAKRAYAIPSIQHEVQSILEIELNFKSSDWKNEIAQIIFSNVEKRILLESLIHRFVQEAFEIWKNKQDSIYVIREAALANSFQQDNCDWLIEVSADEPTRQRRVFQRSKLSKEAFDQRNALQQRNSNFPTEFIFNISNNDSDFVLPEILKIHKRLMD